MTFDTIKILSVECAQLSEELRDLIATGAGSYRGPDYSDMIDGLNEHLYSDAYLEELSNAEMSAGAEAELKEVTMAMHREQASYFRISDFADAEGR